MGTQIVSLLTGAGGGGGSLPPLVINVPADFPTIIEANANVGRIYIAGANVTDNDPTKTNTGQSFISGHEFVWDGVSAYVVLGPTAIWLDDGTNVKTLNPRELDLQTGGLKDSNVTTAVKLGSATDTSFDTTKKDILGAVNEVNDESIKKDGLAGGQTWIGGTGASENATIESTSNGTKGYIDIPNDRLFHQSSFVQRTNESVNDDASISIPAGTAGFGFVQVADNEEWAQFNWKADGTVQLLQNSSNVLSTDTDANLCVFDAGTNVDIKNRLGSAKVIRFTLQYV